MNEVESISPLVVKVVGLINSTQSHVAKTINTNMVLLYWNIGKTIQEEVIKHDKAGYGEQIIQNLAESLLIRYGKGYSYRTLYRMLRFYDYFPEESILTTVLSKLTWSHILEILKQKEPIKRDFYITLCSNEGWGVRELSSRIDRVKIRPLDCYFVPKKVIKS